MLLSCQSSGSPVSVSETGFGTLGQNQRMSDSSNRDCEGNVNHDQSWFLQYWIQNRETFLLPRYYISSLVDLAGVETLTAKSQDVYDEIHYVIDFVDDNGMETKMFISFDDIQVFRAESYAILCVEKYFGSKFNKSFEPIDLSFVINQIPERPLRLMRESSVKTGTCKEQFLNELSDALGYNPREIAYLKQLTVTQRLMLCQYDREVEIDMLYDLSKQNYVKYIRSTISVDSRRVRILIFIQIEDQNKSFSDINRHVEKCNQSLGAKFIVSFNEEKALDVSIALVDISLVEQPSVEVCHWNPLNYYFVKRLLVNIAV